MKTITLRLWPDESLKKVCNLVEDFSELPDIANRMAEIMYRHGGMGLAANQIGLDYRLFLMDIRSRPVVFVNPRVLSSSGQAYEVEGCLSFPGVREYIRRAEKVSLEAQDEHGIQKRVDLHGYEARCALHEIDHLDGLTWLDRMGSLQRRKVQKNFKPHQRWR